MTKLRLKRGTEKVGRKDVLDLVLKKHTEKGGNASLDDVLALEDDNTMLMTRLKTLQGQKKIFRYKGKYYPWRELHPIHGSMYETIRQDVLDQLEKWEAYRAEPVDPVHFFDDDEDYAPDEDKINITWEALIEVLRTMARRGDIENED